MNALLVAGLMAAVALVALAVYELQVRLEQWDYRKHAGD